MKGIVLDTSQPHGRFVARDDLAQPVPRADEIVIRLAGTSVNPIETMMRDNYGEGLFKWLRRRGPRLLGLEGAGHVTAIGKDVTGFVIGDPVMAVTMPYLGGFHAQAVAVPARFACKIPRGVSMAEACVLPYSGMTAMAVLAACGLDAKEAAGRRVLVHGGSGGVGSLLVQIFHAWGAWVATTCSAGNRDFAKSLGADRVIDYRAERFHEVLKDLDLVVNTVAPTGERLEEAPHLSVLRRGGTYVSLISPTLTLADRLGAPVGLAASLAWMGLARLRWRLAAGKHHRWVYMRPSGEQLARLGGWVAGGMVRPVIGSTVPLDAIERGFAQIGQGPARGKILVAIDPAAMIGEAAA